MIPHSTQETADGGREARANASVLRALSLVRVGTIYDLSVELLPPTFQLEFRELGDPTHQGLSFSTEVAGGRIHQATHIDAFIHASFQGRVHGGALLKDVIGEDGGRQQGAERGMGLLGIDTASPDPLPFASWQETVHEELLVHRGIHIVENLDLEQLVRDGVQEFAFVALPLRIRGASGSWIRPVAMV